MMKKIAFAAALVAGFAGVAHAQSSVTVYGRLNTSVERQKDGNVSSTAMVNNASRIGFKGTEDLGGGLKANFLLEHGFNSDDGAVTGGAGAAFWGRESWVGLSGNFGAVRLGNMGPGAAYFATADYVSLHNHDTGSSQDWLYLGTGIPVNNAIAYTSPNFGGVTVEAQVGLKETNAAGAKNTVVLAGSYVGGPLHLGASYVQAGTAAVPGLVGAAEAKEYGLRALYELGAFTVGGYFIRNEADVAGGGDFERNSYRVVGMYTLGASEFHVNVGLADEFKVNGTKLADTDALQYTFAYNYNLSKRTKLYTFFTKVDNKPQAPYSPSTNIGDDFSSLAVGVRHNF